MIKVSKTKRRLFLALAVLLLLVSAAAGCAQKPQTPADATQPAASTESGATGEQAGQGDVQTLEPVELLWYTIGTPQEDQQLVLDEMNKILKEKINATLKITTFDWGAYDERMNIIIQSGDPYDLCYTSSWTNIYFNAAPRGAFMGLTDLLEQYGTNILAAIPEVYWDALMVDGEIYAILNYQIFAYVKGLSVKKDLVDKYEFDYKSVQKLADMEPFFAELKANEPDIVPFMGGTAPFFDLTTGYLYDTFSGIIGCPMAVNVNDPDKNIINVYETEEALDMFRLLRDFYQKGYIRRDAASLLDWRSEVVSGRYASFMAGNLKPGNASETLAWAGFEVVDIPTTPPFLNTAGIIATMTAINRNSANPERAMMFYDLMYSNKELYNLMCYGIEGVHYNMVSDNVAQSLENTTYNPGADWQYGNQFNAFLRPGQDADVWEQTIRVNETAQPSTLLGFNYDKSNVMTELAQMEAIIGEYMPALTTGSVDPDREIPKMMDRLKRAGLEKVMQDAQEQLDNWK